MSQITNEHIADLATKLQFQHEGDPEAFFDYILQKLHQKTDEFREEILTRYTFLVLECSQDPFNDAIIKKNVDLLKKKKKKISIIERVWTYVDSHDTTDTNLASLFNDDIDNLLEYADEEDEIDNLSEIAED